MKKIYYELLMLSVVALWGSSFALTKPLLFKMGVFNFLAYRFLIGGLVLLLFLLARKRFIVNKEVIKSGMSTGILIFITFYFHNLGLKYTSVTNNAFIVGSSVIFIPIIQYLIFKKNSSATIIIQTLTAIIGLALITLLNTKSQMNFGDIFTLIGTIVYAFYTIIVQEHVRKFSVNVFVTIQLLTVGILSLIATFIFEKPTIDLAINEWINIGFLAVVITSIAYYLLSVVQKHLEATNVGLIFTLEPFFAVLFSWVFYNEIISLNILIGGILIFISMIIPYIPRKVYIVKN
jgi:drug/metabolite transporter (DMT)-like permease